jgi:hypothetical protein
MKPHLYINSKGYPVNRHSYSGSDSFNFCARKYYLERIQGWAEKTERSSKFFGTAIDTCVQFYHQHRMDLTATLAEFQRLWAEHKDQPYLYNKTDKDWATLNVMGQQMIRLYAIRYPTLPWIVNNPEDFQVKNSFEVFPGTKLAGLEFTSYIDCIAQLKNTFEPLIIDSKTSGKDVPEFTVLDPQLRSYAWVRRRPEDAVTAVAFLWLRKCGLEVSKGDNATLLEDAGGLHAGDDVIVLASDAFGLWVTQNPQVVDDMDAKFKGSAKATVAARTEYIQANGIGVAERAVTKQKVQFKIAYITKESAEDIGRSIKQDIINIVKATENDFFPMQSGVRFPNEKCPICPMRGICANRPDLRDTLLVRKQLDEFDFGKESE